MRPELNREMDSLLRRAARGGAPAELRARAGAPGRTPPARESAHLDADELSAFAEGALPAAARTLYVAHLADCDECRRTVSALAQSADVAGKLERGAAAEDASRHMPVAGSWLERLLGLFTPRNLRFVAPVLAVSLVGVISYIALRSRPDGSLVTQRTPPGENARVAEGGGIVGTTTETAPAPGAASAPSTATTANTSAANTSTNNQEAGESVADSKKTAPPSVTVGGGTAGKGPVGGAKDAELRDAPPPPALAKPAEQPAAAPPKEDGVGFVTGATAPPTSAESVAENKVSQLPVEEREAQKRTTDEDFATNTQQSRVNRQAETNQVLNEAQRQKMPDGSRAETRSTYNVNNYGGGGRAATRPAPKQESAARARKQRGDSAAGEDDASARDAETVSAAGHRFRRQGGAWVDVEYRTSMPTTGVRRGTDQYRALVADVPEVGRVANQLGGEVIVVVKGKAYRIR